MKLSVADPLMTSETLPAEVQIGRKLKYLRVKNGCSLRVLADRSGLNVNTLSMVENGKTSPSVSTLQQLALALQVPISSFFETESVKRSAIFNPSTSLSQSGTGKTQTQNLAENYRWNTIQPYIVTLEPGSGSGNRKIVHTGHEFVYCLRGCIHYKIEENEYLLREGDSVLFEAHLPHSWENQEDGDTAQILLVLCPMDDREAAGERHFINDRRKEINMKIAVITEDGKTISQHFGRAPYYLVLTIEEGKIVNREMRNKLGHNQFSAQSNGEESHTKAGHGMDSVSHNKHVSMAEAIADCKALICGGMGMGAYESMRRLNIQPVVTELRDIETAAQAFFNGELIDHTEFLH